MFKVSDICFTAQPSTVLLQKTPNAMNLFCKVLYLVLGDTKQQLLFIFFYSLAGISPRGHDIHHAPYLRLIKSANILRHFRNTDMMKCVNELCLWFAETDHLLADLTFWQNLNVSTMPSALMTLDTSELQMSVVKLTMAALSKHFV